MEEKKRAKVAVSMAVRMKCLSHETDGTTHTYKSVEVDVPQDLAQRVINEMLYRAQREAKTGSPMETELSQISVKLQSASKKAWKEGLIRE